MKHKGNRNKLNTRLSLSATIFYLFFAVFLTGCNSENKNKSEQENKIRVVATTGMIADLVQNIGKDLVTVTGLMGPGVDPHLYRASEGDINKISKADIIFYNGLHLEAKMGDILKAMNKRKPTIAIAESIPKTMLLPSEDYENQFDPHVWFDVDMWAHAAKSVTQGLINVDPENKNTYKEQEEAYLASLKTLDAWVDVETAKIPKSQRILITAHDAFNYFGKAYGFKVKGLMGISTESEAGTKDIQKLASYIVENEIKAIFIESSISKRNIQAVQKAAQARGWQVSIGGELFSDAMGNPGTKEGTYIGMVEHNASTIVGGLGGKKVGGHGGKTTAEHAKDN